MLSAITEESPIGGFNYVTTDLTYDFNQNPLGPCLGNIVHIEAPGNYLVNGVAQDLVIDISYDDNGYGYTRTPTLGQPVRISSPGGRAQYFRYADDRLWYRPYQLYAQWDAVLGGTNPGYCATYGYNVADQLIRTTFPFRDQVTHGSTPGCSVVSYAYLGGPAVTTDLFDEGGVGPIRKIVNTYDADGNLFRKEGDTETASTTYDAVGRVTSVTTGGKAS